MKQPTTPETKIMDLLQRAVERERNHKLPLRWALEQDSVWDHVFACVCCERVRGEEERREPRSEVCIRCVRAAGFEG